MLHFQEDHRAAFARRLPPGAPETLQSIAPRRSRSGLVGAALRAFEGLGQLLSASALTHTQYRVMLFVGAREEVGAEIETIAEGVELSLGHAANVTRSLVRGRMITTSAPGAPLRLTVRGGDLLARLARRRLAGLCEAEHRLAVLGRAG